MYDIIKRYCENEYTNGLMLLDMPTGSGKTYSVIKYIFDAIQDPSVTRKFFFVTTLKKNLPEADLEEHFKNAGLLTQFKEKFLRVDSNYESVIAGFKPEVIKSIPSEIKKTDEYKALEQYVSLVKNLRDEKKFNLRNALLAAEDSLRKEAEPKFRRMLQVMLAKKYTTVEGRLQAIKTEMEWQWVAEFYPSVYMRDRQIIFMSMDKFLSMNSTIVEPSTMLYNSDLIDNAVVFIDEFDATKETVLKTIIQNGLRDRIDYVELFNAIYSALHTHSFPAILTTPSKRRQEGPYKDQSLQDVLDKTIKIAEDIHNAFLLQYSHKTENVTDENANNFLFQDHQYHSILDGNKSYVASIAKQQDRVNAIRFTDELPESDEGNIQVMLGKLRGFISYFMIAVRILAINYQQSKAERRIPDQDEFTLEEAIRTVLAEFKLTNTHINYLTSQILVFSHKYKGEIQAVDFDVSFYQRGFRYYAFEDNYAHDMHSKIMMYSFQITPERLLLRFCEKAKVLGISATATIPSAIGNYDLKYLKEKLQDRYVTITDIERNRLQETFDRSQKGYDKVKIHTQLIGCDEYSVSAWRAVVDSDEKALDLYNRVEKACSGHKNNYYKELYLRIAVAFKSFLIEQRIQSFLCVLTRHPKPKHPQLDIYVLHDLFDITVKYYGIKFDVSKNVVQLDGEEYDTKKDEITRRLGNGERLFVISVYQTIGAGQNLQYPVPEDRRNDLIAINNRAISWKKDFDAIYLDMPTNLLVQLSSDLSEEEFIKYLFQVEILQESGEVSVQTAISHIKKAFRTFNSKNRSSEYAENINNCHSVILLATRVIIQAVGRMCRTNLKPKDIYIFADRRIADRIDISVCDGRMFNREFLELVDTLRSFTGDRMEMQNPDLQNIAQLKSIRANKYINSMLRESWTESRIVCWKELREMVLAHPTLSADEFDTKGIAYNFYIEMPRENSRIYYKQEQDFNNVQVFFSKEQGSHEVSAKASKLESLMKIDFLKRHFEKHRWSTSFSPARFILPPPMFNNIYRGALGEVVGKALFYRYADVILSDIEDDELFEKFDYAVPNSSVLVDFKNWHESSYKESDKELFHIAKKAKDCGARCVIIANILADGDFSIRERTVDGINIVIIPALLENEDCPVPVNSAWEKIQKCIREYSN